MLNGVLIMTDDKDLNEKLNRPNVPVDLEEKIRINWKDQKLDSHRNNPFRHLIFSASLISIVVGSIIYTLMTTSNDVSSNIVSVAINDIKKDEQHNIGITLPIEQLLRQSNIHLPPNSMPIKMAKLCNLAGNRTTHIKIAGAKQGSVHLFVKFGNFNELISNPKNSKNSLRWKLVKPRANLSVLVIYTEDMSPSNVEKLIQSMFYA